MTQSVTNGYRVTCGGQGIYAPGVGLRAFPLVGAGSIHLSKFSWCNRDTSKHVYQWSEKLFSSCKVAVELRAPVRDLGTCQLQVVSQVSFERSGV